MRMESISKLVKRAKKSRTNRVYYERCFNITDIRLAGVVQAQERSLLDRVQLEANKNEHCHLFGVGPSGSFFKLDLTIVSLYPDGCAQSESQLRLASVDFVLSLEDDTQYTYKIEQFIDYNAKRQNPMRHEHSNVYKLGSLSIETVLPFSLTRILFNGMLAKQTKESEFDMLVPMRLTISTHPTCDKLDFKYCFSTAHTKNIIKKSLDSDTKEEKTSAERLLELTLEDRFDQPMMFQCYLKDLDLGVEQRFIMWGAKSKKFLDAKRDLQCLTSDEKRESLFAWAESGVQLHLSRPIGRPELVYGLVHNNFDYASYFYDCKLLNDNNQECTFDSVKCFQNFSTEHKICVRGFKLKEYKVEFVNSFDANKSGRQYRIKINGFKGWASVANECLGDSIRAAQARFWQMQINDSTMSFQFAQERLLGGKANSLVQLAQISSLSSVDLSFTNVDKDTKIKVSVPRGIVLTCQAYQQWIQSDETILKAINKLDRVRRSLAAKSVHVNPLADDFLSPMEASKQLKKQCNLTGQVLRSCPLPESMQQQLLQQLINIFGQEALLDARNGQKFAIRSSAVGEDSLETSAAGQMKTILGAQGKDAIYLAIVQCWTSQFELEAVSYKSQNGLEFNLPMSVVVQELIDCQVAGVAATCNPLNGNKMQLEITANFGLGEGVVSGQRTDTVRLDLARAGLKWDEKLEAHKGQLDLAMLDIEKCIEKLPSVSSEKLCLSNEQIVALGNLLLQLRRLSGPIKEREIEWGITTTTSIANTESQSSSSSSSSSSVSGGETQTSASFQIHLLQSRPLTHLQRLEPNEIEHELDYGVSGPMDIVSRANLGEVMPGSMCALNSSFFIPVCSSYGAYKPFEKNHTRITYAADSFGFYAQMTYMVYSYTDTMNRLLGEQMSEAQKKMALASVRMMIGTGAEETKDEETQKRIEKFHKEKCHPLAKDSRQGLGALILLDSGLYSVIKAQYLYHERQTKLNQDLTPIDVYIENLLFEAKSDSNFDEHFRQKIEEQIDKIWQRLCGASKFIALSWKCHILGTLTSMFLGVMCLNMMMKQPAYPDEMDSKEILNDFSIMMRQPEIQDQLGGQTESGDICKLLTKLIELIVSEGDLELVKQMTNKQLYDYLVPKQVNQDSKNGSSKASELFRNFLELNSHRAYKEFCLATKTWGDDCSYIINCLSMRLKQTIAGIGSNSSKPSSKQLEEHSKRVAEIERKITRGKFVLTKYAFPRARHATVRREQTKSLLIRAIHKYRLAFRHLGALLCLLGRLPSVDLVFWLTIDELDQIVNYKKHFGAQCSPAAVHQDLPRLIYKARRRQQRARAYQSVTFPRPSMRFDEMVEKVGQQLASSGQNNCSQEQSKDNDNKTQLVKGLTSCSGKVTGRACVVSSIVEMDQMEANDILITYSIDISWSVYFFSLAGIVTELGGIISHGAVVAREYGIPTLCTAIGACSKFKTGQLVTLDADNGVCYLADSKPPIESGGS